MNEQTINSEHKKPAVIRNEHPQLQSSKDVVN